MDDQATPEPTPAHKWTSRALAALLVLGGVAFIVLTLAGALHLAGGGEQAVSKGVGRLAGFGPYLAAALVSAGITVGLAAMLGILRDLLSAVIRMERFQYEQRIRMGPESEKSQRATAAPAPAAKHGDSDHGAPGQATWGEMLRLLRDIRDNSLLSDQERSAKKQRVAEDEIRSAREMLRTLNGRGEFAQARELAERISHRYPDDPRAQNLVEQVEEAREQHESHDIRASSKQVDDLLSISAWDRARELAQQLQQRHPDSVEARQLLLRIEREYQVFQDEQRRRMHAEIQRYVSRRRWKEALAAAKTFVERFPGCSESEALRLEIPTLKTNAEIEVRQELEEKIMEFAKTGRYMEAAELAKKVIEDYPDSPQAGALRSQLGRLEELANNPDAPPARMRLE